MTSATSCPVEHSQKSGSVGTATCPVDHATGTTASLPANPHLSSSPTSPLPSSAEGCPYSAERQEQELLAERNNMPPLSQKPSPGQKEALDTEREESTIPMGGKYGGKNWVYPSEQMFFNAMKRKNWDPSEKDMSVVVPIHNAVNEQCWRKIMEWESLHQSSCAQPKLLKFQGRPKDFTPKARFRSLLGYKLPFDRHDWTVDRCGKTVEYVIDFYSGAASQDGKSGSAPVSFYLDVRPKVSVDGIADRMKMWWQTGQGLW